jgi:hypothetical protein
MFSISPERFRKLLEKGIAEFKQVATIVSILYLRLPSYAISQRLISFFQKIGVALYCVENLVEGQESLRLLCFLKNWSLVTPSIASERSLSLDFMYFLEEAIELAATSKMEKVCLLM